MAKAKKEQPQATGVSSTVAKTDDGTVQITLMVPHTLYLEKEDAALADLSKTTTIAGFRPGKAPLDKVRDKVNPDTLVQETFAKILPQSFADAVQEHKLVPALYPKFEIVKKAEAENGNMWEVLAVTCELPTFDLPDYKTIAKNALAVSALWTPEKGDAKDATKEPTREEKENKILTTLLDSIKVVLPHMLIDEEVNARLSSLLQRIEKLGLTLEGYLSSIGKTVENLREDYHRQAEDSLKIELLLTRIADEEKIHITDEQIDQAVQVSAAGDPAVSSRLNEPDQRRIIGSILRKRAVLDSLLALG